ncbi:hypothetical protein [Thermococcus barophilus]|uniref:Yip1 domain-containing protein n=2 Tax=Thermococcus barophilus TaxID=55802 RepID=A0A0S1XDP7_THEBA|nr:hypothetical protein [Thermococcus barophilus]ADT84735.1 hypothetical protein TERMP_01760 [Thermococcus barophilus MP]ALM75947.1 conserved membrane hypothetical protein [Thermococcus barophilus]
MAPVGPMAVFGALGAMAVVMFLVIIAVDSVFLWLGAKFAKIEDASFGKAFIATLGGLIVSAILGSIVPVIGGLLGLIAFLWIVKTVFNTDWGKAVIAWLFAIVIAIILMVIIMIVVGLSVMAVL